MVLQIKESRDIEFAMLYQSYFERLTRFGDFITTFNSGTTCSRFFFALIIIIISSSISIISIIISIIYFLFILYSSTCRF